MTDARKKHFVDELKRHYAGIISEAREAEVQVAEAADTLRTEARSREDAKGAAEFGRMAQGQRERRERTKREVDVLIRFAERGLRSLPRNAKIGLGALVDVSIEDENETEERTCFLLPVGAGIELYGPGGDGFVMVVTPESPVGRGLMGASVGDSFEIVTRDHEREWSIVDSC
jgi:transcription elongation GreA/GreB family factor